MQGNTFTNNVSYDYANACDNASWPTMQKWIDANLIQTHDPSNIANCAVFGNTVQS